MDAPASEIASQAREIERLQSREAEMQRLLDEETAARDRLTAELDEVRARLRTLGC